MQTHLRYGKNILRGQVIVVRNLDALVRCVKEQDTVILLTLFQHHNADDDAGSKEQISQELNFAVHIIVIDEILTDLPLHASPVHDTDQADDDRRPVGGQPEEAMHDKRHIHLALGN